jgi:hypothetical protein
MRLLTESQWRNSCEHSIVTKPYFEVTFLTERHAPRMSERLIPAAHGRGLLVPRDSESIPRAILSARSRSGIPVKFLTPEGQRPLNMSRG